jgi:putative flippase GtrA
MKIEKTSIRALFLNRTDTSSIQFFRYTFVGGAAFIVDFGSLFVLTEFFNIHYLISAAIAFLLGLIINYALSVVWVFSKRILRNKSLEFGIFAFIGIMGLGLNELFIWFFTEYVHFHYLVSKIISTAFVFLWNFGARKFILFR